MFACKKLDYLDLEIKPHQRVQVDQFNLPYFSQVQREHLFHTEAAPQLNFISDILILLLQTQKQSLERPSSSSGSSKVIRNIEEKLEYLRFSLSQSHLQTVSSNIYQLEASVRNLAQKVQNIEQLLVQIYEKLL